jgi:hypothetical protein
MAKELQFIGDTAQTGLTVTAKVYDVNGAQVGGDVACPEIGSTSIYIGDMVSTGSGEYSVRFYSGSTVIAFGSIFWDGVGEINNFTIDADVIQSIAWAKKASDNAEQANLKI